MNTIFKQEINSFVLVYLDDILIYSRSEEEHWGHLAHALDNLRRAKLYGDSINANSSSRKWITSVSRLEVMEFAPHLKR